MAVGRLILGMLVVVALVGSGGLVLASLVTGYTVSAILPNAANLFEGGSVMENGNRIGTIDSIDVEGDQARVTFSLYDSAAPLHDGATVAVTWKAVLGERLLEVADGEEGSAEIPTGGMLTGDMAAPVEVDQVLAALDPPTRERLNSLVDNLDGTLQGSEGDINATVRAAGPALHGIGSVLRGLGTDGEAIRQLATQLNDTMGILAQRDQDIEQVVHGLGAATGTMVGEREQLAQSLELLPQTLRRANTTLGHVPGVVDEAVPLLDELAPATERLPAVAASLRPVLADLRPTIAELRPTLDAASELLQYTPGLLDTGTETLPQLNEAFTGLEPTLDFLRPYTPEFAGVMSNWGSMSANFDANGHYSRIFVQTGMEAANVNPGVTGPGVETNATPMPGELVDQPWADAFGSGMR